MSTPGDNTAAIARPPSHGASYGRYVLWMLLIINFLAFLDRQILNILAEPIKQELKLSDTQLGLLTGLAFAFLYTFLGLPIARLAERANRVGIIGISLAIWSAFTIACGFANSYAQLALARVGVGVGEAGCSPASHSLISDYVPREKRASALGFYSMGVPLGTMAGLAFGGLIADAYGWRVAIVVAGAPGILVAILARLTIRDTRRQHIADRGKASPPAPALGLAMRELTSKRAFWWAALAASSSAFLAYGHNAFYASFFLRNHAQGIAEIAATVSGGSLKASGFLGIALGLILGLGGLIGSFLGGRMCDHFAKRDPRANVLLPAGAFLVSLPFVLVAVFIPHTLVALLMLGPAILLKTFWYGPIFATVQNVVQPGTRATAAAILLGMMNLIGLGLGPVTVGIFSDAFAGTLGPSEGLRWGLAVTAIMGIVPPACLWMASRTLVSETVEDGPSTA
ncbi:MFS transporter [Rhizorhabdus dicambivorans]|uniref:MFS transporter n=2 Tax=Rhizorhabdus dicambivorans TaxID=1850238 RepID=A0A2A4FQP8_9SPHN|nr:MFS transporter [Rhizorhabdus dicambivorans]PCE40006.1 MFS transporter [Rhizorhabdus dicambivorans]